MHHGTCVTHVPWCMSGSLTCGDGENVPGIPGACAPAILRIWQEAHSTPAVWCLVFTYTWTLQPGTTVIEPLIHPTLCWACDYLSMLGFKLIHVSKGAPGLSIYPSNIIYNEYRQYLISVNPAYICTLYSTVYTTPRLIYDVIKASFRCTFLKSRTAVYCPENF